MGTSELNQNGLWVKVTDDRKMRKSYHVDFMRNPCGCNYGGNGLKREIN